MSRYTVTAQRSGQWWALQCVQEPGALSQTRSLAKARELMKEAIGFVAQVDPAAVEIDLQVQVPEDTRRRLEVYNQRRADFQRLQEELTTLSPAVVRDLHAAGLSSADVAAVLGTSPQRVSQLTRA